MSFDSRTYIPLKYLKRIHNIHDTLTMSDVSPSKLSKLHSKRFIRQAEMTFIGMLVRLQLERVYFFAYNLVMIVPESMMQLRRRPTRKPVSLHWKKKKIN
jgi:hypothetical protein